MSYSVDQATYRQTAVMWAFIVMRQGDRLDEAAAEYDGTLLEQPRSAQPEVDDYRYWWATWTFGADQYFFLAAAAQLRKCVLKLPHDELLEVPNERMILLLRNFTEHWEDPTGWSATELRGSVPGAIPGRATYTKKDVWVGGCQRPRLSCGPATSLVSCEPTQPRRETLCRTRSSRSRAGEQSGSAQQPRSRPDNPPAQHRRQQLSSEVA